MRRHSSSFSAAKARPSAPPLSPEPPHAIPVAVAVPLRPPPPADEVWPPMTDQTIRRSAAAAATAHRSSHRLQVDSDHDCCPSTWPSLGFAAQLVLYHVGNTLLGAAGFVCVLVGLALSLLLLPACGVGIVVFHVLVDTTYRLSCLDAALHNVLADSDGAKIEFPEDGATFAERAPLLPIFDPRSAAAAGNDDSGRPRFDDASLRLLSPRATLLMIYFGSVKFVLTMLTALTTIVVAFCVLAFFSDDAHINVRITDRWGEKIDGAPWVYVACLGGMLVGGVALHVLGRVSQAATRFFCCENRQ